MRCSSGMAVRILVLLTLSLLLLLPLLHRTKAVGRPIPSAHATHGEREIIVIIGTGNTTSRTRTSIASICRKVGRPGDINGCSLCYITTRVVVFHWRLMSIGGESTWIGLWLIVCNNTVRTQTRWDCGSMRCVGGDWLSGRRSGGDGCPSCHWWNTRELLA